MNLGIKHKRVLISGGSNGIGKELALQFAKEGCKVTLISRNKNKLKNVVDKIGGKKKGHYFYNIDLLPEGNGTKISKRILNDLGVHDIIVHCVGGALGMGNPLASYTDWLKVWRFNVGIAIEINNVFVKELVKKKWGRVIHVSSISAIVGDSKIAYASSKSYLNSYVKGLSKLFINKNIVFSAVMPGPLLTKGKFWDKEFKKNPLKVKKFIEKNYSIKRFARANEICPFIMLLASKHASYAAGTIIPIDGGKF